MLSDGKASLLAPKIPGRDDPKNPVLDPTIPENIERIKGYFEVEAIRTGAGDGIYLIGCNTMSHLSAGVFEMCRIGDDTSGRDWDRTRKMGVNTLAFRLPQHNRFYAVDGDCVGLTTDISWERNRQWLRLLAGSGAPLFVSAQPEAMGAEQRRCKGHLRAQRCSPWESLWTG